jgi:hypothetical protein
MRIFAVPQCRSPKLSQATGREQSARTQNRDQRVRHFVSSWLTRGLLPRERDFERLLLVVTTQELQMHATLGLTLLVLGLGLTLAGRQRANGTRVLALTDWTLPIYPAVCLAFLAFGVSFLVM